MVLSKQPGHTLESQPEAAQQRILHLDAGTGEGHFEPEVRGAWERDSGMSSSRIGRRSEPSHLIHSVLRVAAGAMLLMLALASVPAHAQSAKAWDKRGQQAEAREDFDAAFEAYRQAHLKKPTDLRYRTQYERLRFQAANQHIDRGRVLRQSGDTGGAVNEFARALQIDPGNQAAAQELQTTDKPAPGSGPSPPAGGTGAGSVSQTPHQADVQREIANMGSPVSLMPVSNDPITLHMVEDVKVIYQAVGKAAGLNVLFDPDYTSKRIPVDLTSVSLYDALRIIGTLSGTFWKPVTSNTIFVAQNNRTKRTDLEDLAVQTFYLTNAAQQNDANEILITLRNILDPSIKVYLVASQNAIIMRATTDQLILAEKIINDLDRTRPEVVIDVAVLEVSRQKERDLGITLPTSFGLTPQTSNATSTTPTTTTTGTTTPTTTGTNLTLNNLANINATNFAVTVTGGTVNALLSDSDTRTLQNPRIRATDGQKASLKIGSKIPVATGSYNAGVSTGIANIGVQTQFTYLDVGVNIEMTPTVHYDREISLKMKIEISTQSGQVTISGVTEPIISQRVIDQVIQLRDGEPSILAGLVQKQDQLTVSGTPGLGEIPFLKYFFSSQDKIQQQDEIVFLVIPHIVRESILTEENTRAIYSGTSQSVELLHNDKPVQTAGRDIASISPNLPAQQTSAANAASAMLPMMAAQARPVQQPAANGAIAAAPTVASAPASSAPVNVNIVAPTAAQAIGSTFQVTVMLSNAKDLSEVPLQMHYDPRVLSLVNVDVGAGGLLSRDGQAVALTHRDEGNGQVTISAIRPPHTKGVDGQGTLCTLTFKALAAGDSPLTLLKIGAKDSNENNLPTVGNQAVVHVK
jgi:general secretion pathway protein D